MKQIFNKLTRNVLPLLAVFALVTACSDDNGDDVLLQAPALTFDGVTDNPATVAPGEEITFDVLVSADAGFNTIFVEKTMGLDTEEIDREARPAGQTTETYTYSFSYTPTAEEAGEQIIFDFTAVDDQAQENTITFTVNVSEVPIRTYSAFLLYAPDSEGGSKTWFSTSTGQTYTSDEVNGTQETVSDEIDFGYYYGATNKASLASPASYPSNISAGQVSWSVLNSTLLEKTADIDATEFDEITTSERLMNIFEAYGANADGVVSQLAVGDVITFKTAATSEEGERYGLIKVVSIEAGDSPSQDYIELEVKVQE